MVHRNRNGAISRQREIEVGGPGAGRTGHGGRGIARDDDVARILRAGSIDRERGNVSGVHRRAGGWVCDRKRRDARVLVKRPRGLDGAVSGRIRMVDIDRDRTVGGGSKIKARAPGAGRTHDRGRSIARDDDVTRILRAGAVHGKGREVHRIDAGPGGWVTDRKGRNDGIFRKVSGRLDGVVSAGITVVHVDRDDALGGGREIEVRTPGSGGTGDGGRGSARDDDVTRILRARAIDGKGGDVTRIDVGQRGWIIDIHGRDAGVFVKATVLGDGHVSGRIVMIYGNRNGAVGSGREV